MNLRSSRRFAVTATIAAGLIVTSRAAADAVPSPSPSPGPAPVLGKCSGSTWTFAGGRRGYGAGQVYTTIRLKNTSGRACALRGYAAVTLLGAHGTSLGPVRLDREATHRIVVPRAGTVHLVLHTSNPGIRGAGPCLGPSHTMLITPPDTHQSLRIRVDGLYLCRSGATEQPMRAGA